MTIDQPAGDDDTRRTNQIRVRAVRRRRYIARHRRTRMRIARLYALILLIDTLTLSSQSERLNYHAPLTSEVRDDA